MHGELLEVTQCGEHRKRDHATAPPVQSWTCPDIAPGVASDQVLEVGGKRGRAGDGSVDVLVAEDRAANVHARGASTLIVHGYLPLETQVTDTGDPVKWANSMPLTSSGRSTLAR